jgi:non-specific serine/threonine protein kinase
LRDNFQLLHGGRTTLPQHQTLAAAIQWSYDLLPEIERCFFRRLAVFSGGWTLEAAETVSSDDTRIRKGQVLSLLTLLVNKSLVVADLQTQEQARYHLLKIVRQYCHERLTESRELEAIQDRHIDAFLHLVQQGGVELGTARRPVWLKRLSAEHDNIRAALTYGLSRKRYTEALKLAGGLFWFWQTKGHVNEGRTQLETILAISSTAHAGAGAETMNARAKALWAAGGLAWIQADYPAARAKLEASVSLWRQLEPLDRPGLAVSLRELGIVATYQGDLEVAHAALEESIQLLQIDGNQWDLALTYYNLGLVFEAQKDVPTARLHFQTSLALFQELSEPWGLSVSLYGLGRIAARQADYVHALAHLQESLVLCQKLEDTWSTAGMFYLFGEVARLQNDTARAVMFFIKSLMLNQVVGDRAMIGFTLHNLGKIAHVQGRLRQAARLYGMAKPLRKDSGITTSWSLTSQEQCEQDIAALRGELREGAFEITWLESPVREGDDLITEAIRLVAKETSPESRNG